jgi:hypothetical protein
MKDAISLNQDLIDSNSLKLVQLDQDLMMLIILSLKKEEQ